MQNQDKTAKAERPKSTERPGPMPLAERLRRVRKSERKDQQPTMITDWASI